MEAARKGEPFDFFFLYQWRLESKIANFRGGHYQVLCIMSGMGV